MNEAANIGVIGAGAWGTALATMLASDGREILLWARDETLAARIDEKHANPVYLPDIPLASTVKATSDLARLALCDILLVVTPAQHMRSVLQALPATDADLVLCSKGIEANSQKLMVDVAAETVGDNALAVLSGPTFAHEVARAQPTAVTLACSSEEQWDRLSDAIGRPHFRPYYSPDIVGAEIGGAVKNVLAIACGVVDGLGLGQNARAALISRGFAEMLRFGTSYGAQAETLAGLSGLGDLVLTCSSTSSRNFSLGVSLGKGQSPAALMTDRRTVAEGASTAPVLQAVARARHVDMPIVDAVCALLRGECSAAEMVHMLLARPLRAE